MYKINQDFITFVENNPKLVTRRESTKYPGLFVIKYTRKVFYDGLWNDVLEECRGLVVDKDWNAVVVPFKKIYNRGEKNTDFSLDVDVTVVEKINGFMGAVTYEPKEDRLIYSTTGSLDSDFASLAEKHLRYFVPKIGYTFLFEICDKNDPHIITEFPGAYLIGARNLSDGSMVSEEYLDNCAEVQEYKRPDHFVCKFGDLVNHVKNITREGYVVHYGDKSLKIKSPHYLITKFLARANGEKFKKILNGDFDETIDEEFYPLIKYLRDNYHMLEFLGEQDRIAVIREFLSR